MDAFFRLDGPLMRALSVAADLIVLNILTVLCSLPILTLGASLTALHDVLWHLIRGEESYTVRSFFRSFRKNFLKGNLIGIIFTILFIVLFLEWMMLSSLQDGASASMTRGLIIAAAVLLTGLAVYSFALLSRYENTIFGTLKNAFLVEIGFLPRTVGILIAIIGYIVLVLSFLRLLLPIFLLFGFSLPSYVCALLYTPIFKVVEGKNDEGQEPKSK